MLGRLLTAAEVAAELGVSKRQVYRWHAEHGMPAVQVGRALRFHEPAIETWLSTSTNGVVQCPPETQKAPGQAPPTVLQAAASSG